MTPYRTALADYVTIFTGLSTLAGGIYSIYVGKSLSLGNATTSYWDVYLQHGIATAITVISLYFFLNQSLKLAKRVVASGSSALPGWLVLGLFYFAGIALFCVFQIVFQSNIFDEIQIVYFIVSVSIWLIITIPLMVTALIPKRKKRQIHRKTTEEHNEI